MANLLGVLSIVFAFIFPPLGIILGIIGIINSKKNNEQPLLSIIGLVLSLAFIVGYIILLGTIAYSGVLNPASMLPPICSFEQGMPCVQYARTGNNDISMTIQNGLGRDISIVSLSSQACANHEVENALLPNGQMANLRLLDCQFSSKESMTMIEGRLIYRYADIQDSLDKDISFMIRIKS